jgi:phage protein D
MPDVIPIYRETTPTGDPESFYVPSFQVKIKGRDLEKDVLDDVTQVSYTDKVDDLDSFEITVNNWDAEKLGFKYEPPGEPRFTSMFDPGQKIELYMGYMNNRRKMLVGEITTLQPNFPESGAPTLTVGGLNVLHGFRKKQHTWSWTGKTDSQIAREIATGAVSEDRPGLGLTRDRFKAPNESEERPEEFVFMNGQFDIVFMLQRARHKGYTVCVELKHDRRGNELPTLTFGRSEMVREVTYELEWGKTLASFRPTLQTANQISKVTVRGWDRRAKRGITGVAELRRDGRANTDWNNRIARAVEGRHEEITNLAVRNRDEATRIAKDRLANQTRRMITATGSTVGLPDLRAGCMVIIRGVGATSGSFNGQYFVTETTHTINDQGYRTQFKARREGDAK